MNTWGYLILIAALSLLTAYMLYARFAARSREKSLHHAPAENPPLISFTSFDSEEPEITALSESPEIDLSVSQKPDDCEAIEEERKKDEEYFDELQDAAAGLAMLMRSSPAQSRSDRVVFAPDDAVEETLDVEPEAADVPPAEELMATDSEALDEAIDGVEAILEEPPVFEESELPVSESGEADCLSLQRILGDEVVDQLAGLDEGLDQLEDLVTNIEDQVARLQDFVATPLDEEISEAA